MTNRRQDTRRRSDRLLTETALEAQRLLEDQQRIIRALFSELESRDGMIISLQRQLAALCRTRE